MSAKNKINYPRWQKKWLRSGAIEPKRCEFNRNYHPEMLPDEVFITNADDDSLLSEDGLSNWDHVGWKTKRRGNISYDYRGNPLGQKWPGSFPVFAKQSEIQAKDPEILKRLLPAKV